MIPIQNADQRARAIAQYKRALKNLSNARPFANTRYANALNLLKHLGINPNNIR